MNRITCFRLHLTFLLCLLLASSFSIAQPISASVTLVNTPNHQSVGTCFVTLSDTNAVTRISVELRDRIADSAQFIHEFVFDQISGLPLGLSWQRTGNEVNLGLGLLPRQPGWTGRVKLRDLSGTWSDPLEFVFQ